MRAGKSIRAAIAATVIATGLMIGAPSAQADPGFCGVRNDMGQNSGSTWYYVARNQCSRAVSMRIVLLTHNLPCQSVPANSYGAWESAIWFDPNWYIVAC